MHMTHTWQLQDTCPTQPTSPTPSIHQSHNVCKHWHKYTWHNIHETYKVPTNSVHTTYQTPTILTLYIHIKDTHNKTPIYICSPCTHHRFSVIPAATNASHDSWLQTSFCIWFQHACFYNSISWKLHPHILGLQSLKENVPSKYRLRKGDLVTIVL